MTNFALWIASIVNPNFRKVPCQAGPQKILYVGAHRVGRGDFVTSGAPEHGVIALKLRKWRKFRLMIIDIFAE
jgi:hypothetical protein